MSEREIAPIGRLRRALRILLGPEPEDAGDDRPEPEEPQSQSLAGEVSTVVAEFDTIFRVERNRLNRLQDYEDMDQGDVGALLDATVDACLISDDGAMLGFEARVKRPGTSGKKYQTIVNQMLKDTRLVFKMREYLRKTLKRGDTFLEIIYDEEMNIRGIKSVPPRSMRVKVDEHGNLQQGTTTLEVLGGTQEVALPYWQINDLNHPVASWFPWEMFHIKWMHDDELTYSDGSFIEPLRRDWKRQKAIEDGLAVARIQRAYLREIHYVDVHGKQQEDADKYLRDYRNKLTERNISDERRVEWPKQVRTNYYVGVRHRQFHDRLYEDRTKIDIIDPRNTGLENISDVEYLQQKLFRRVPAEVVGAGSVVGNDLTQQDVAASKLQQYCQFLMSQELIIPLCLMAVRLKGFNPDPEDFEIVWPGVVVRASWRFADSKFRESMANVNYAEWGVISRKRIAQDTYRMDDEEWEAEVEQVNREQGELPSPNRQSDVQARRQGSQSEQLGFDVLERLDGRGEG